MNALYAYRHYVVTTLLFAIVTVISQLFRNELEMVNIVLIHLLPIIVIALQGNLPATMAVTTLSIALLALYIPPTLSFIVHEMIYLWSFVIFYLVGTIITMQARRIQLGSIRDLLFNTLSHDLKTPLASIMGNATFLMETHTLDPALRYKALSQIIESSRGMNRLIATLLDSARLQDPRTPLKHEWCDMEDLIAISLREFRRDVLHERIMCRFAADLPLFYGDCALLVRLFVNLIDNALKYSDDDKPVEVSILSGPASWKITISNECTPLPAEELAHLFDRFYRAGNATDISGSGIGLAICRDIALAHRGEIRAYNRENGISVEVTLPVLKRPQSLKTEEA